jgi:hypothetical protein
MFRVRFVFGELEEDGRNEYSKTKRWGDDPSPIRRLIRKTMKEETMNLAEQLLPRKTFV